MRHRKRKKKEKTKDAERSPGHSSVLPYDEFETRIRENELESTFHEIGISVKRAYDVYTEWHPSRFAGLEQLSSEWRFIRSIVACLNHAADNLKELSTTMDIAEEFGGMRHDAAELGDLSKKLVQIAEDCDAFVATFKPRRGEQEQIAENCVLLRWSRIAEARLPDFLNRLEPLFELTFGHQVDTDALRNRLKRAKESPLITRLVS